MRIIAGEARGIRLQSPEGKDIRPTKDRVKESLFSIIHPRLEGCAFLDLYCGSGANGLEALSRGAARAVFIDTELELTRTNLKKTRLEHLGNCIRTSLPSGLKRIQYEGPFDIIFADPPYVQKEYDEILTLVAEYNLLNEGGIVILEHHADDEMPQEVGPFHCYRRKIYGQAAMAFYEVKEEEA